MKERLTAIALLTVLTLGILFIYDKNLDKEPKKVVEDYVPVTVEKVRLRDIAEEVVFSGEIKPSKEIMVVPTIPGKVAKLSLRVGDEVDSGETLFTVESPELQRQVKQAKSTLDSAKLGYEQAQLAGPSPALESSKMQVSQAESAYSQAVSALEDTTVKSPIDGIVSKVNVYEGDIASNAQPSMVIIDTSNMYVEIDVAENIVSLISEGQNVAIDIPTIDYISEGIIEIINPTPDERTQLYKVKIAIDEVPEDIKSGMFARINLDINSKDNVIAVNSDALIEDGEETHVYVVKKDKAKKTRAVKKEVEIGVETGEYTEITKGLKKNEEVIVEGKDYVEDKSRVKVIRGEK